MGESVGDGWTSVPLARPNSHHNGLQAFDSNIKIRVIRDFDETTSAAFIIASN